MFRQLTGLVDRNGFIHQHFAVQFSMFIRRCFLRLLQYTTLFFRCQLLFKKVFRFTRTVRSKRLSQSDIYNYTSLTRNMQAFFKKSLISFLRERK